MHIGLYLLVAALFVPKGLISTEMSEELINCQAKYKRVKKAGNIPGVWQVWEKGLGS